jgi:predicted flap endonuclease-1-like 5' DNA nuclease
MTNGFGFDDRTRRFAETFQLDELPQVDPTNYEPIERAAIERLITEQQESLVRLQADVLDVRTERNALEHQLTELEEQRARLQDRVRELEAERPALSPSDVFTNLGAALDEVDDDLAGERYRVDDVDFTLKANVIQTSEGLRMHLPSLDETSASANLSEISFRLRAPKTEPERTGAGYTEVPDLRGLSRDAAARRLAEAGLTVGTVETAVDPESRPGTVVEQFPGPYTVAEPEAPVDFVLAAAPEPPADAAEADEPAAGTESDPSAETDAETEPTETDERDADPAADPGADDAERVEALREALVQGDPDDPSTVVDRLRRAGIEDVESLVDRDAEALAESLSIPVERIVALQRQLDDREPIALEEVSGIGPTYAERLRRSGIRDVSQLATRDPETISEVSGASTGRTETWVEQARDLLRQR